MKVEKVSFSHLQAMATLDNVWTVYNEKDQLVATGTNDVMFVLDGKHSANTMLVLAEYEKKAPRENTITRVMAERIPLHVSTR